MLKSSYRRFGPDRIEKPRTPILMIYRVLATNQDIVKIRVAEIESSSHLVDELLKCIAYYQTETHEWKLELAVR